MEESNPELESFRQKWREEVIARSRTGGSNAGQDRRDSNAGPSKISRKPQITPKSVADKATKSTGDDHDNIEPQPSQHFDRLSGDDEVQEVGGYANKSSSKEPRSALEHYEKAVERETQGSLGDSLDLYRKAFRLDHQVDRKYKNKHFPPSSNATKLKNLNPSNASATVPNTAHHSLDGPPRTLKELIISFSDLSIEPAPPAIEGTPPPPCPFAELPDEILIHILMEVAILDVADFVRLAQVCKRMAYIVLTEEQIWKRICSGSEVGFGAMHYKWQCELLGEPLSDEESMLLPSDPEDDSLIAPIPELDNTAMMLSLLRTAYSASWQQMFRLRPRIRFNGCYISTVNYIRAGQASASQVSWNSPVHIVTYYRYLRFFRDGTVISLLTTTEPSDVVHHLTMDLLATHRDRAAAHLPSSVMSHALRGRWRLSSLNDSDDRQGEEGTVYIETEGAVGTSTKYMYRMELKIASAGKNGKNNKLAWKGYWNYNRLTDDWAEFTLRNDKAFFWSRVRSYGTGA
ncbi:f-box domain-containing protein [Rutstroemia sp. NJR-2017a BBW]|nr:f-box domain-containing protein [Rutstroemia sp. NJR-2017a BBW]